MSSELAALEELKGRCQSIKVCYLDTGVRMEPAIDTLQKFIEIAIKRPLISEEVDELGEEIASLRGYLMEILKKYPEVKRDFKPTIEVCDWLIGPVKTYH